MAGKSAILTVKILTDAAQAGKGVDQAAGKFGKFQSSISKLTPYAAAAGAAVAGFAKVAVDSASRTQQAMGAVDSVFGAQAGQVKAWAAQSATSVGLASSEYMEFASQVGAQLQNMGLSTKEATGSTNDLIGLGADLAATFGGSTADAVGALSAALRGEADPAERYGLSLSATAVNAALAEKGMDKLTGQALTTAKAQTILEMATDQAGGAVGQFARESDTAAGSAQIAAAQWENAKSALGEALLPVVAATSAALGTMAQWMKDNATAVTILVGAFAALAAGVLIVNAAMKAYQAIQLVVSAVTKGVTVATKALNAAFRANPIGFVITAVMLLVAGIVLLWNKNKAFRNFVTAAWKAIATAAKVAWNAIRTAVAAVIGWILARVRTMRSVVAAVWSAIRSAARAAWNGVRSVVASVVSWIVARVRTITGVARAVWSAVRSAASSAFNGIRSIVNNVVASIKRIIQGIKSVASSVFNGIKSVARGAMNAILGPVRALKSAFDAVAGAVRSAIGWIGRIKFPKMPSWLGGRSAKAAASASASTYGYTMSNTGAMGARGAVSPLRSPTLVDAVNGLRMPSLLGGGGNVTIVNVSGTLNDAEAARKVRRVLRNDSRRRSGVVIDRRRSEAGV